MSKKEYHNHLAWMFETIAMKIEEKNKRTELRTNKLTLVFDLDQFSMRQLTIKLGNNVKISRLQTITLFNTAGAAMNVASALVALIKHFLSNYPECFLRIFVINGKTAIKILNFAILNFTFVFDHFN
jgi:hypothetical protein